MLPTTSERDAQASELLRICCEAKTRTQLLAYARKLAGADGEELLQQGLLDAHDAVQGRGTSCEAPDYRFFVMRIMQRRHIDEQRRRGRHVPLPDEAGEWESQAGPDSRAHLAEQVATYVATELEPTDRIALRLKADGYGTDQIEQLTGRPASTVRYRLAQVRAVIRAAFEPGV